MEARRIEVKRILSRHVPTINIHIQPGPRLRSLVGFALRSLGAILRVVRAFIPKRAYLILE